MKHARKSSRLRRWGRASALASALAFVPAALVTPALAHAAPAKTVEKAECQVHTVLASKEGDKGIPKDLEFLRSHLSADEFAIYKSFYLVEQKAFPIKLGEATQVKFGSGHRLGLSLLGGDAKRIKLHAKLTGRDGAKQLLAMEYSIDHAGALLISAGKHEHNKVPGKLFFAIQCAHS